MNRDRETKPESRIRSNQGSPEVVVPNYDEKESLRKSLGLWNPMDHAGHAKDVHASRWIKGGLTITGCDGRDTQHIGVPGFWFLWPCIIQIYFRT